MNFLRIYKKGILLTLLFLCVISAGYFVVRYFMDKEKYTSTPPPVSRDILGEAGNMTFTLKGVEVSLNKGVATVEGLPGSVKMMSKSLEIDFNDDKTLDRAVIIKNDRNDGSMYFYTSVVLVGKDGVLTNTNTIPLGEGSLIQRMIELPDNAFSVEYLERKSPKDSPSIPRKRIFQVNGYALTEVIKK